ncbi:MAG: hypothetical protein ABIH63_01150 [archaeon]
MEHDYLDRLKKGNIEGNVVENALEKHTVEDVRLSFMQGCLERYCNHAKKEPEKALQYFQLARETFRGKEIKYDGVSIPQPEKK